MDQAYADRRCEEDVFIRLTPVEGGRQVDVELLGAHGDRLLPGGAWSGLDAGWAHVLFDPTQTLMGLLIDVGAGECTHTAAFRVPVTV
ncbi:MAG: hypothetical protein AUG49_13090 [Catenulispora sp. 13_1_20CM_3_70_7]|nr:MAG: hypothetical protein AUG49_13090 [Catenulispora sp. 13_1_20CM_3_70_7]